MTTKKKDTYQIITDTIIEAMESRQIIPWRKTWTHGQLSPMNIYSGTQYRGINALLCALTPHSTPYFLTLKQANSLGGSINKGAKSIPIVFWNTIYKDQEGNVVEEETAKTEGYHREVRYPRYYRVFNIEDVSGIDFELEEEANTQVVPTLEYCEKIIQRMPSTPQIKHGKQFQPSYNPISDTVKMPERSQFENSEEYYLTLFHELIHCTGHESRIGREAVMSATIFGSLTYSQEELVAEIGATFLASVAGIKSEEVFDNSIAYLQGWIKVLKEDKKMLLVAAGQARKAVEYVMQ